MLFNAMQYKIWVTVNLRFGYWTILDARAKKNKTSVAKELEKILAKELKEMVEAKKQ